MSNSDQIQRFLFEGTDLRGVLVGLESSYAEVLSRHSYPVKVASLLGEMLAAIGLLSSTLKFEGRLSLLARGQGSVSMLMAECNHQRDLRAIARWQDDIADDADMRTLLGDGQLAITIEPERGNRYQGIVPLEKPHLSQCLEDYFMQSEQLATRIILAADNERAAGMLLQALPSEKSNEEREEDWNRITHLGTTLSSQELLTLDNDDILHRLYHEEEVRLFEADELRFACDCSRERSLNALKTLQPDELQEMLSTDDEITIDCQFCNNQYRFDRTSIAEIQGVSGAVEPSTSCH